jgi:16S rRNA C967 or C1407 C5-methylase (RsmB/RsmF family)
LNSPSLFVSNNDARFIPNIKIDIDVNGKKGQKNLRFDRILCDVPCSGDGTLRKNILLWKTFSYNLGHGLHSLQLDILERGFALLKKGGRLVYSTCSFNPLENEAVVAAALSRHIKQMELVDISQEVSPFLKSRPGRTNWKVFHKGKGKRHPP